MVGRPVIAGVPEVFAGLLVVERGASALGCGYSGTPPPPGCFTVGVLPVGCLVPVVPPLTVGTVVPVGCLPVEDLGAVALGFGYSGMPPPGCFTVGVLPLGCLVAVARLTSAGRPAFGCIELVLRFGSGVVAPSASLGRALRTAARLVAPVVCPVGIEPVDDLVAVGAVKLAGGFEPVCPSVGSWAGA